MSGDENVIPADFGEWTDEDEWRYQAENALSVMEDVVARRALPDYRIRIRPGLLFWRAEFVKTRGIRPRDRTYRGFTRAGLLARMRRVYDRKQRAPQWQKLDVSVEDQDAA